MLLVKSHKVSVLLLFLLTVLSGEAVTGEVATSPLRVESGYVREMPPGQRIAAGYMTLLNTSKSPVRVVAVKTTVADKAELHETLEVNGLMRMSRLDALTIPPGERVSLQQGGSHLMLLGVEQRLVVGGEVIITLCFDDGSEQQIRLPVKRDASGGHSHH